MCQFGAEYDDWPDGSITENGLIVCADCLGNPNLVETLRLARNAEIVEFAQEVIGI